MVKKEFCDVCGEEVDTFLSTHFYHSTLKKEDDPGPGKRTIFSADLCHTHGDIVREMIEQMKEEHSNE